VNGFGFGRLTGTVSLAAGGAPLQEARVFVVGTALATVTGQDGKYTFPRVPSGTAEVRVLRLGYQEQKKSVRILDGQTATLDFTMTPSVVQVQQNAHWHNAQAYRASIHDTQQPSGADADKTDRADKTDKKKAG